MHDAVKQSNSKLRRARNTALALVLAVALALAPALGFADVRKADVVLGSTVDARGLSISQCPAIEAEYACVMSSDGTVYFERSADESTQIASITKIMTALVALEQAPLDTTITVSARAAQVGESSADLQEGDTMSLETALVALMVPSGNDAAIAIAESISGDEESFVELMNQKAAELGCTDTLFENAHGLDSYPYEGNQHSCASDVALMVQAAMQNDTFRNIVCQGDTAITVNRGGSSVSINLESTDWFLYMYEYAIGVKTGYTELAGNSFAGAANKDGFELYAIVLDSTTEDQRFEDARILCEWVYEHEVTYQLANSTESTTMELDGQTASVPVVAKVSDGAWIDKTIKATFEDPEAAVEVFDLNGNISQTYEFNEISGNVKTGDVLGTATFKQRNEVIATLDIVACEDVDAPGFFDSIGIWWDRLFRNFSGEPQEATTEILNETPLLIDKTEVS